MKFLSNRINLLLVDDEESLLLMLRETFSIPYINIVQASSMKEAKKAIVCPGVQWHCWVVDMCLGEERNAGSALIEGYANFPFAIVYSGLGSMESAAAAIQKGAAAVVDKGVATLEKLIWEVCLLMPLGVLCKGVICKKKEILFLLREHTIQNPSEWAEKAGISLRQMENISITATGITPSFAIRFYYGLRYLLATGLGADKRFIKAKDLAFYRSCVGYLAENQGYYRNRLFR